MKKQSYSPSELARETLKTLAWRKLLPTPDNYARVYAEIGGIPDENTEAKKVLTGIAGYLAQTPVSASAGIALKKMIDAGNWEQCLREIEKILQDQRKEVIHCWPDLIRDLLRQLETSHKGLTLTRKKEGLEAVLTRFAANPDILFDKLNGLIRSWSETPQAARTIEIATVPQAEPAAEVLSPGSYTGTLAKLSELLAQALETILSTQPELTQEVQTLALQARGSRTLEQITALSRQLRQFWIKVELHGEDKARIHEGLVRLLRLLVENIGEMVEDEEWLHGQISVMQEIIANPLDRRAIADAERSLRDTIIRQGMLKQSLSNAKTTLKSLMTTFIGRLGEITESTGNYHQKLEGYSQKISKSSNITELSHLLDDIMQDTRTIQTSALRSHEELLDTRKQVQESEARIREMEQELAQLSELVREDQLTGALNRRGLDEALEREVTRADRSLEPVCIAVLDIDNFKLLNDNLGHLAGDHALVHLSNIIKEALRPSDLVARYGGEEFIVILPGVDLEKAAATIERLQRELTRKFFLHENKRILITFSAGVAQRAPQESQEDIIGRADKAMYQAKKAGRNRVVMAE